MQEAGAEPKKGARLSFGGRSVPLPRHRWQRVAAGLFLIAGGFLAVLPVFGLWMIPAGLLVLSIDFAIARRFRRRAEVSIGRRRQQWRARRDAGTREAGGK